MPLPWNLGNDIVDLADPRHTGKPGDHRFLRRVFSRSEQLAIAESEDPDRDLWIRWAAKEAAFKTISKSREAPPTFVHTRFQVSIPPLDSTPEPDGSRKGHPTTRFGEVQYEDVILPLRVEVREGTVHAVTWLPPSPGQVPPFFWESSRIPGEERDWRRELRPLMSEREWRCVSHRASALARLAARRSISLIMALPEGRVEIGCRAGTPGRRIPIVFLDGREIPVDLTLSHHGKMLAWAFLSDLSL